MKKKTVKKCLSVLLVLIIAAIVSACSSPEKKTVFDRMSESTVAFMESSDGTKVYIWNTGDIESLASLEIEAAPMTPSNREEEWIYRIIFNPKEKVANGEEITVSFHKEYIQIDQEYYLPKQGINYDSIFSWAEDKFSWLVKEYGAE